MDDELRAILDRQKRMAEMAERLPKAPDIETLLQWVSQMEAEAKELEKRAVAWGKKMEAAYPPKKGMHGYIEVVLTPDQRAKIKQETGIVLESVRIDDPSGALNYAMMSASPALIQFWRLNSITSMPSAWAISSVWTSMACNPCGAP